MSLFVGIVGFERTIGLESSRPVTRLVVTFVSRTDGRTNPHHSQMVLVLLGLTRPHMNGEEAYRELRPVGPHVRVVPSIGYKENDRVSRFAGKGLAGFIQKPYTPTHLRDRLRVSIDGSETSGAATGH